MTRNARFIHRFRLERLERRDLLCSSMASTAGMQAAAQIASFAQSHTVKAASEGGSSAADESSETHLFATLTNSSNLVVGTAFYETEVHGTTTTQELLVNVAGGAANASYAVTVGTTSLGTLTTDVNGNGRLYLTLTSSSTTASASAASTTKGSLPAGFTLAAGATVGLASTDTTVDALNGTFAVAAGDLEPGPGHDHLGCGGEHGSVSRLVAPLTNSGTSAGKAVFTTITQADGTSTQILRVRVTGAEAGATLDVSIDGTSVGSITTDADGNGNLILSSNPHNSNIGQLPAGLTITSTSTITVGTAISGAFSSTSSSGSHGGNDTHGHSGDCGTSTTTSASVRSTSIRRR
jgi:large repetitive protein